MWLTSKGRKRGLKIYIPESGVWMDGMVYETGGEVPAGRFIQPRIEA